MVEIRDNISVFPGGTYYDKHSRLILSFFPWKTFYRPDKAFIFALLDAYMMARLVDTHLSNFSPNERDQIFSTANGVSFKAPGIRYPDPKHFNF